MSSQRWPEISSYLRLIEEEKGKLVEKGSSPELLEGVRRRMVHHFEGLKHSLDQILELPYIQEVVFALRAVVDEEIKVGLGIANWNRLVERTKGETGDAFYEYLNKVLDSVSVPALVYETYYYALKRGFQGKYKTSVVQIRKYLEMLVEKIPIESIEDAKRTSVIPVTKKRGRERRLHYYLFACGGALLLYFSLLYLSRA